MLVVRIEHPVPDYPRWKEAFDRDPADRQGSGVRRYRILRARDDPNHLAIDLEFDAPEEVEAFLRTMRGIREGPGGAIMHDPRARVPEPVETKEVQGVA